MLLCRENNDTVYKWLPPPAASAGSRIIFQGNVQRSVPLFSLQHTELQKRKNLNISERQNKSRLFLSAVTSPQHNILFKSVSCEAHLKTGLGL